MTTSPEVESGGTGGPVPEPVAIVALIRAVLLVAASFGLLISDAQRVAIVAVLAALIPIVEAVGAWYVRRRVTPVDAPAVPAGVVVTRYRARTPVKRRAVARGG